MPTQVSDITQAIVAHSHGKRVNVIFKPLPNGEGIVQRFSVAKFISMGKFDGKTWITEWAVETDKWGVLFVNDAIFEIE